MTVIESIGTAVPKYRHSQEALCQFLGDNLPMEANANALLRRMAGNSAIANRHSVIPDFSTKSEDWTFVRKSENSFDLGNVGQRMEAFFEHALPLSLEAIQSMNLQEEDIQSITHLIAVTCTGIAAPGLDLQLIRALNLSGSVHRTGVQFMGCYAAIHALKQADYICRAEPSARVLIVCTELCTLHIQADARIDNLASTLLFGDGAAAVLLSNEKFARKEPIFKILSFASRVVSSGLEQMAWNISEAGFLMNLGAYVPDLVGSGIGDLLEDLLPAKSDQKISGWAIHPGGRKILEKVSQALGITEQDLISSYKILNQFGNMSSPTVLFVIKEEHQRMKAAKENGLVFSAAFGPGLTMESLLLEHA